MNFPGGPDSEESTCNVGDLGSIPGSGRSPGGGHGNPLQYSCLENPMDRGAWWATVHGVAKSQTLLSDFTFTFKNLEVWETIPAALGGFMAVVTVCSDFGAQENKVCHCFHCFPIYLP